MKKNNPFRELFYRSLKKILLTMRIAVILMILGILQARANDAYSQKTILSLNFSETELVKVLDKIEVESEFFFLYNEKLLDTDRKVSITANDQLISVILDDLFAGTDVKYTIVDRKIILAPEYLTKETDVATVLQQKVVSGIVTEVATGLPMPGVTVLIKGTTLGTLTDTNGKYTLSVADPNNAILVFSFIGYGTKEVTVASKSIVDLSLEAELTSLDEVVVIGYGTVKRKDLTGAVASIGAEKTKDIVVTRVEQILGGRIAGVQVKSVSGEPGVAPQIRIRGIGSISAGVDPLYVVDGLPTGNIQMLNPNDIESIDILKDASATAIYGSRGSNGVILINTKRGKEGRANITFDTYFGYQKVEKLPEMKNAMEQAQYTFDGFKNKNLDEGNNISGYPTTWTRPEPQKVMDVLEGRNTYDEDALDAIFRTAPQKSYQLGANGGNENVKYALSGEYLDQDGIVINNNFKRYSLRANIDAQLTKRLAVKLNINPSYTNKYGESSYSGEYGSGTIGAAVSLHNFFPLLDENGEYTYLGGDPALANTPNPLAKLNEDFNNAKGMQILGNINVEYTIFNELKFNIMLGGSILNNRSMTFTPKLYSTFDEPAVGTSSSSENINWVTEYTLNYNKSFGSHNITGLAGFTAQKNSTESESLRSNKYPNNIVYTLSAVSNLITAGTSNVSDWSLVSYLARLNYNFKSKYYATASIRTDGSSRFGSKNKYGVFPSMALAWRISDENFLKDVRFLSELKLRTSYGESGNNEIGNYEHYATISYENYDLGNAVIGGYGQAKIDNPFLTWEKQKQFNIGSDISLFNGRLNLTVDHFRSRNIDLLLNVNTPLITGFGTALQNIGEVKNTGWEFVISSKNLVGKFMWSTDFNISTFKNKVVKLGPEGDPIYSGVNITKVGEPLGMFYGLIFDGIFMNQAELDAGPLFNPTNIVDHSRMGDMRFVDISGPDGVPDGIINTYDNTIIASPYPDFYYGMTNNFSYKNISLTVNLQGVQGNQIYNLSRGSGNSGRGRVRSYKFNNNYWKSEAEPGDGKTQRPNDAPSGGARLPGSQFLDNGSFLRITNITLSYSIPNQITRKVFINSLRVYISATNPFLFTKYTTFNPDVSLRSDPLRPGLEQNDYPLTKGLIIGLNAAF